MNYFVPKDVKIDCEGDLEIIEMLKNKLKTDIDRVSRSHILFSKNRINENTIRSSPIV